MNHFFLWTAARFWGQNPSDFQTIKFFLCYYRIQCYNWLWRYDFFFRYFYLEFVISCPNTKILFVFVLHFFSTVQTVHGDFFLVFLFNMCSISYCCYPVTIHYIFWVGVRRLLSWYNPSKIMKTMSISYIYIRNSIEEKKILSCTIVIIVWLRLSNSKKCCKAKSLL